MAYPGFHRRPEQGRRREGEHHAGDAEPGGPGSGDGPKDGTQRVLDNLNTRIWFRLTDDATAKLAVEGLGMTSVGREEITHSLNFGGDSSTSGRLAGGDAVCRQVA